MNKIIRKITSSVLALTMLPGVVSCVSFTVSAAGSSKETAEAIDVNVAYTENIGKKNEFDFYKFTLTEPSKVYFTFSHDYIDDDGEYWQLISRDFDGLTLLPFGVTGKETEFKSGNLGLDKGTYIVRITSSENYSDADYTFTVHAEAAENWESEPNNYRAYADPIELNTLYNAALQHKDDTEIFEFTLEKTTKIKINFFHEALDDNLGYWRAVISNEDNKTKVSMTSKGNETESSSPKITLGKGTYYLNILDSRRYSNIDYSFEVTDRVDTLYGDVDSDWEVNAKDRIMLTRYLSKWSGYEKINEVAADVNKDNEVNSKDRIILTRYLAKWKGYDKLPQA